MHLLLVLASKTFKDYKLSKMLLCTKRSERAVRAALHWLPVSSRIDFKILLHVFKALNGLAPACIYDLLTP